MTAKLTPAGKALLTQIGMGGFSYFDDGIRAGSGIWEECLTAEAGSDVAATAKGVAQVARKLARDGFLAITDVEEDSPWVELTAAGADLAHELRLEATAAIAAPVASPEMIWRGTVRETKTIVAIYDGASTQNNKTTGRWITHCEAHTHGARHATRAIAWTASAHPKTWCPTCAK